MCSSCFNGKILVYLEYDQIGVDTTDFTTNDIKNKYRWRIVLKCKVTSKVLDIINYAINDEIIKKSKDTSVVVDINPSTMN